MQIRQPRCRCREGWHDPVSSLWGSLCLYLGLAGRAQTVRSAHVVPPGSQPVFYNSSLPSHQANIKPPNRVRVPEARRIRKGFSGTRGLSEVSIVVG